MYIGDTRAGIVYVNSSERKRKVLAVLKPNLSELFFDNIDKLHSYQLWNVNEANTNMVDLVEAIGGKKKRLALSVANYQIGTLSNRATGPADFEGDPTLQLKTKAPEIRGVRELLNTVGAITIESFEASGRATITENNALLRIEVEFSADGGKGKTKETLLIGPKIPNEKKSLEQYYARLASEDNVVRVGADRVNQLLAVVAAPTRFGITTSPKFPYPSRIAFR